MSILTDVVRQMSAEYNRRLEEVASKGCAVCGQKPVTELETVSRHDDFDFDAGRATTHEVVRFRCSDHALGVEQIQANGDSL